MKRDKYRRRKAEVEAMQWAAGDFTNGVEPLAGYLTFGPIRRCQICGGSCADHGFLRHPWNTLHGGYIVCPGSYLVWGEGEKPKSWSKAEFDKAFVKAEE